MTVWRFDLLSEAQKVQAVELFRANEIGELFQLYRSTRVIPDPNFCPCNVEIIVGWTAAAIENGTLSIDATK